MFSEPGDGVFVVLRVLLTLDQSHSRMHFICLSLQLKIEGLMNGGIIVVYVNYRISMGSSVTFAQGIEIYLYTATLSYTFINKHDKISHF